MNKKILIAIVVVVALIGAGVLWMFQGDKLLGLMKASRQTYQQCMKYETWYKNGVASSEMSKVFRDLGAANTAWTECKNLYDVTAYYTKEDCLEMKEWFKHGVWTPEMEKLGLDADADVVNSCNFSYGINIGQS